VSNNGVTLKYGLQVTEGHWNWYHSKLWYSFVFAFHSNYVSILKLDIGSKSYAVRLMPLYWNIAMLFDVEKLEWCGWLATQQWKNSEDIFSRFDTILACDGQTADEQTSCDSIVRAMPSIIRWKLIRISLFQSAVVVHSLHLLCVISDHIFVLLLTQCSRFGLYMYVSCRLYNMWLSVSWWSDPA